MAWNMSINDIVIEPLTSMCTKIVFRPFVCRQPLFSLLIVTLLET